MSEDANRSSTPTLISSFCNSLAFFCDHLQSSSQALKESLNRRPIPLDSASSTFIQCLNRRVSSVTTDLELLESMSFGTVSFEELLGHCNELYKINHAHLVQLHHHLSNSYGYSNIPAPDSDFDCEDEIDDVLDLDTKFPVSKDGSNFLSDHNIKTSGEDVLLDESLSFKKFGLSDSCLSTLANEAMLASEVQVPNEKHNYLKEPFEATMAKLKTSQETEVDDDNLKTAETLSSYMIKVSEDEFQSLPGYLKSLVSWEDLLVAVEKINSIVVKRRIGCNFFRQDEIPSFELGSKARSYLLLLVRMNRLAVETIDGLISYRVL